MVCVLHQAIAACRFEYEHRSGCVLRVRPAACRLHAKTVKRLEKRLQVLAADHDAARQELLIKAAELLDMQAQLKESERRQQLHQDDAAEQVGNVSHCVCKLKAACDRFGRT